MRQIGLLILFCSLTGAVLAVPAQGRYTGDPIVGVTARSLAMGEVGLIGATGPIEGSRNPAQLAYLPKGLHVEAVAMFPETIESRSFPIYDGFAGVLAQNQYTSNSMGDAQFALGASFSMKSENGMPWTVAFVTKPVLDYYYTYFEEVRDRYSTGGLQDRILGRVSDKTEGVRRWTGLSAAVPVWNKLSAGLSVGINSGSIKTKSIFNRYLPSDSNAVTQVTNDPDNAQLETRAGLTMQVNNRLRAGVNLTLRGGWNDKITTDTTLSNYSSSHTTVINRTYPTSVGGAIEYIPGQALRSRIVLELEWTNWKSADLGYAGQHLLNTMEVRAGVEHRVLPEVPVRFGFRYAPSPFDQEMAVSYLSGGTGYESGNWNLDLAIQFGHLNTTGPDPVPDNLFGGLPRNDLDQIQDRMFRFTAGVSYTFGGKE